MLCTEVVIVLLCIYASGFKHKSLIAFVTELIKSVQVLVCNDTCCECFNKTFYIYNWSVSSFIYSQASVYDRDRLLSLSLGGQFIKAALFARF